MAGGFASADHPNRIVALGMRYDDNKPSFGGADQRKAILGGRIGSGTVIEYGSPKAVEASSNETPCFRTFAADFAGSQVKPRAMLII